MSEYILKPKPGFDAREVKDNPNVFNSTVWEYRYGRLVNIYPATRVVRNMFNPKLPPEFYREEKVRHISLDKPLPEGNFAAGVSPFIQAIVQTVSRVGVADFADIYRGVVNDFQIARDSVKTQKTLRKLVTWMSKPKGPSYLTHYKEGKRKFYRVGVVPKGDPPLVNYRKGVDPIKDQICQLGEMLGTVSFAQIKEHVIDRLGWLTYDGYLRQCTDELVKNGNFQKFGELYRYVERIEGF